jgi:hypothetical protein
MKSLCLEFEHAPLTRQQLHWVLGTEVVFEVPSHTCFGSEPSS